MQSSDEPLPGDPFAKVVGDNPGESTTRVVMRFTSLPQPVRDFLDGAERRYEYHTIEFIPI